MKLLKHWQLHLVQKSALIAVAVDTAVERLCPLLQSVRTISTPVAVSIAHAALVLPNITSSFLSTLLSFLFSFGLAVLFALVLTLPLSSFVSSAFALQFTTASTATRKLTPAFAFLFFSVCLCLSPSRQFWPHPLEPDLHCDQVLEPPRPRKTLEVVVKADCTAPATLPELLEADTARIAVSACFAALAAFVAAAANWDICCRKFPSPFCNPGQVPMQLRKRNV